jgi:hypothetical protein
MTYQLLMSAVRLLSDSEGRERGPQLAEGGPSSSNACPDFEAGSQASALMRKLYAALTLRHSLCRYTQEQRHASVSH